MLNVPMELLTSRLFPVVNGVVAHLSMGNLSINDPFLIDFLIEFTLSLNASLIILIDEDDFRRPPDTSHHHIFADDISNIKTIDGQELHFVDRGTTGGLFNHFIDLYKHVFHAGMAAGRPAKGS